MHDMTPRKVTYTTYVPQWEEHTSEREYIPVDNVRGTVTTPYEEYSHSETDMVNITLYLDPRTGLVVFDIAAYEKHLQGQKQNVLLDPAPWVGSDGNRYDYPGAMAAPVSVRFDPEEGFSRVQSDYAGGY